MKRTTILLTNDLALPLEREARRQGTSVSEVARRALQAHLRLGEGKRHLPFAGVGASGYTDTAARLKEILAEEWTQFIEEDSGLAGGR